MKALVNTTGPFSLVDYANGRETAEANRPSVITLSSPFFAQRAAAGQLLVLGHVNDEATDEEFAVYLQESEGEELAVAAFLGAYAPEQEDKKAPARGRGKK